MSNSGVNLRGNMIPGINKRVGIKSSSHFGQTCSSAHAVRFKT